MTAKALAVLRRVVLPPFRVVRRAAFIIMGALIVGMGGGMGVLAGKARKVDKPEADNPIVWVAEENDPEE